MRSKIATMSNDFGSRKTCNMHFSRFLVVNFPKSQMLRLANFKNNWTFLYEKLFFSAKNLQLVQTGVSQVASIFDGSCQIHWQDPQRKLATTAKSTNRIRSGSYRALPNSHRIRFRIRWRVAKFRQDPQTGSAQPLPNSTQDPQDRIRNHCQISTGSVKQDPQPLPNFRRIPLYRIRSCQMSGVSTVIESKPPIILTYSKMFIFVRSRGLGRVTCSYLGMFWMNTFPFTCKKMKVQKIESSKIIDKKLQI